MIGWQTSGFSQEMKTRKQTRSAHCTFYLEERERGSLSTNGPSIFPLISIDLWHLIYLSSIGSNEVKRRAISPGHAPLLQKSFLHTVKISGLDCFGQMYTNESMNESISLLGSSALVKTSCTFLLDLEVVPSPV